MSKNTQVAIRLSSDRRYYVPGNRYLSDCDEHWYTTNSEPLFKFSEDEIEQIKKWLVNAFIYSAEFISQNGSSTIWEYFKSFDEKRKLKEKELEANKDFENKVNQKIESSDNINIVFHF